MPPLKRQSPLDRLLGRADNLDSASLAILAQRLAGERDLLETVFNTIQEGVLLMDATGVVEYANDAAAVIIGLRAEDWGKVVLWRLVPCLARSVGALFGADTGTGPVVNANGAPASAKSAPPPVETVAPALTQEIEVTYPERRFVRLHMSRLHTQSAGRGPRFVVILRDVTAERRRTEELVESERAAALSPLAAGLAHELGNPLNSINLHLQVIRRQLAKLDPSPQGERIADSARVCSEEVERLDALIHNFLGAIRPVSPASAEIRLLDVIAEVLALLKKQCEDLGVRVAVNVRHDLPVVSGDHDQLKQVFFNLLKNAMEAMDKGGVIDIAAESDDEFVTVSVRDCGAGIEREAVSRIFDPFFTTKSGGHGLGMFVVSRILHAHGGDIAVESTPGHGTTVTVRLPQKHRRFRVLAEKTE
ncbi:MAG: PAS domain-containing protein [Puniceicoccales bacterium]|jgi:signal transduction histidine kinase|nr:PAS domain-containing protein [Puniceicoccales bacterium]